MNLLHAMTLFWYGNDPAVSILVRYMPPCTAFYQQTYACTNMLWSARKISIQREPAGSHNFYLSTKSLCFEGKSVNNGLIDFVTVTTWCAAPYIEINLWYQGAVDNSFKVSLSGWYPHFTVFRGWAELIYKLQTIQISSCDWQKLHGMNICLLPTG